MNEIALYVGDITPHADFNVMRDLILLLWAFSIKKRGCCLLGRLKTPTTTRFGPRMLISQSCMCLQENKTSQFGPCQVEVINSEPRGKGKALTWKILPCCGRKNEGTKAIAQIGARTNQDLQVKGSQPFSNILDKTFRAQPAVAANTSPQRKKMISFADSRLKCAELALSMQDDTEMEWFRSLMLHQRTRAGRFHS